MAKMVHNIPITNGGIDMASKSKAGDVSPGAVLAEYVGTFMLAFAVLASVNGVMGSFIPTAAVAGFTLFLAALSIGGISGAHINPGVTLGLFSLRKVNAETAVSYVIAQVAGAFSASAIMNTLLDAEVLTLTAGDFDTRVFVAEALGMLFFGLGVAAAVHNKYKGLEAAALVGGSLFFGILVASVLSNGILNPAVAFALESVNVTYLLAPVLGAALGMHLYNYIATHD